MTYDLTTLPADYKRWYNRGWRYSGSGSDSASLEHGDAINAPDAWYDGYLDRGAGREKWHHAFCAGCPEHPDGCPQPFRSGHPFRSGQQLLKDLDRRASEE